MSAVMVEERKGRGILGLNKGVGSPIHIQMMILE